MKEEFKSLAYGIFHNPIFFKALIGIVLVILVISGCPVMMNGGDMTMEEEYSDILAMIAYMSMILTGCAAAYIFCDDFGDKTLNYEILIGKSRRQVYLARIIVAMSIAIIGYVCVVLSIALSISIWGFGSAESEKWLFIRLLMLGFEHIRTAAFLILACQVVKTMTTAFGAMGLIYLPMIVAMLIGEDRISYLPIGTAVQHLATPELQNKYNIAIGGIKQYARYDWSLSGSIIAEVIVTSILFTALYLFLGWIYFKKDDLP